MKKELSLKIAKPCLEKWSSFSLQNEGGFCGSCNKVVVDFTTMSDEEIINKFSKKPDHVCGRFRTNQLRTYVHQPSPIKPGFKLIRAGVVGLFLLLLSKPLAAQTHHRKHKSEITHHKGALQEYTAVNNSTATIRGVVKSSDDGSGIPGVSIILRGSTQGISSDGEGRFEFPSKLKAGDVLDFMYIGYESQHYSVSDKMPEVIDIVMNLDMMVLGEVSFDEVYTGHQSALKGLLLKVKALF